MSVRTVLYGDLPYLPGALCADPDEPGEPEWWTGDDPFHADQAKKICYRCPERAGCYAYALARPGIGYIWGGTNEPQRTGHRGASTRRSRFGNGGRPDYTDQAKYPA